MPARDVKCKEVAILSGDVKGSRVSIYLCASASLKIWMG